MPCDEVPPPGEAATPAPDLPVGVPPLGALYLYASGSCNLACRHCYIEPQYLGAGDEAARGRPVPLEYVKKAIDEGRPLGLAHVKLTGGEPTLHPRFRELVNLIAAAGLDLAMETNGTLLDDDLAAFLRATGRFSSISVSLDGAEAEAHDALRGVPGSFRRAVAGLEALVRAGFRPQAICTLHRGNVGQVDALVDLGRALGCGSVKFNFVQRLGRGRHFADRHGLKLAEVLAVYHHLENDLRPRAGGLGLFFDMPLAFQPLPQLLHERISRCSVLNILGLLPGGQLSLCGVGTLVPELVYGHLGRDSLRQVWCEHPALAELRETVPAGLTGICARCLHRNLCRGHCPANTFHASGRLDAPYPFCRQAEELGLFPASRLK
jgi:SynChlorMet cassette radical SAM/SPASM protein ScmF